MGTLSGDGVMVGALSVGGEVVAGSGTADAGKVIAGMGAAVGYGVEVSGREVTTGVVVSRASTVGVLVGVAMLAVVATAVLSVGEVTILAVEAVGKKAGVSATLAICVATSPTICSPKGVTVGRGALVGVCTTGGAEVQPAKIARLLITASKRRIVPHDSWSDGTRIHPNLEIVQGLPRNGQPLYDF